MLVTLSIYGFQCDKTQLSFTGDILSCCFLVNFSFIFLPSPVLHYIVFHEKVRGMNFGQKVASQSLQVSHLKGRGGKAEWDNQSF